MTENFADILECLLEDIVCSGYRIELLRRHTLVNEQDQDLGISEIWYGDQLLARVSQEGDEVQVSLYVPLVHKQLTEN